MEVLGLIINICIIVVRVVFIAVPLLVAIAYMTLVERKVIASIQRRKGPNVVGLFGLLQPFADAVKLLSKESVIPSLSNKLIFVLAPIITLLLSLMGWAVFPLEYGFVISDISIGILYIFAVSSLGVYGVITSGWSSNSRYAFLGALRSAAQMVSYEVSIGLIVVCVLLFSNSLNMTIIVYSQEDIWNVVFMNIIFILFFISSLAETNRPPFDLPEAEAELVAGYFVEYSSMVFALFFIGEYGSIMLMSGLCSILFLGGWVGLVFLGVSYFGIKIVFIYFLFVWVRSAFPRYRYDQLMRLGWKVILPLSIGWVVLVSGFVLMCV